MKKLILIFTILFTFIGSAYTYPDDPEQAYYLKCHERILGDVTIYFTSNTCDYLSISGTKIINTSSSTVYGYAGSYRITFPSFDDNYFYTGTNSSIRNTLNITEIYSTNLVGFSGAQHNLNSYAAVITIGILLLLLVWRIIK